MKPTKTPNPEPKYVVDYYDERPEGVLIDGTIELLVGREEAMEAHGEFRPYDQLVAEARELSKLYLK